MLFKGCPEPRMSSKEGIPVDRMGRALAEGEGAVPAGKGVLLLGARLVNTDGMFKNFDETRLYLELGGLDDSCFR
jgi:hypothetical protein